MSLVRPKLDIMEPGQIQDVHDASLNILSKTGIKVHSSRALEIFMEAEGTTVEGDRVYLAPGLVQKAIESAPEKIHIYDREGQEAFQLTAGEDSDTIFGIGVTNTHFQDPETDEILPFDRGHVSTATRLGNSLENFSLISTPGVIQDPHLKDSELQAALEMLANTKKPLVLLISNTDQFNKSLDLFQELSGALSSKPFIIPYFNPITPLVLNKETSDKMIRSIEMGLPIIYSSYGMSGATAPISAAGTLAMLNAELLAGLVFAQLVKPSTPVILGCLPSVLEMKHMISAYTPQTMLVNLACSEMMSHYRIPHSGTSGSGAGWGPDLMAGGNLWVNHLTSALSKVGLAPFVGGNFDSLVFSPPTVIYSNEIIRQTRLFAQGFDLSDESISLETIMGVGPAGNFLMTDQTLNLYREIHKQHTKIWPGYSLDQWQEKGSPAVTDILRSHTLELMDKLEVPDDHDELIKRGEAWIASQD